MMQNFLVAKDLMQTRNQRCYSTFVARGIHAIHKRMQKQQTLSHLTFNLNFFNTSHSMGGCACESKLLFLFISSFHVSSDMALYSAVMLQKVYVSSTISACKPRYFVLCSWLPLLVRELWTFWSSDGMEDIGMDVSSL